MELIGLYLVACGLLVAAGLSKAVHPADTARALAGFVHRAPGPLRVAVRAGAVAEAALGALALVDTRSAAAWLVAVSYFAFTAFVAAARRRGGAIASCGCFGTPDTPATVAHVVINLVLALSAVSVALAGPGGSIVSLLRSQPLDGVPLAAASGVCMWLSFLAMAKLAQVEAARRLLGISRQGAR